MFISLDNIHSMTIHFPIALFCIGFIFDVTAQIIKNYEIEQVGFWNMCAAIIFMPISIISGIYIFLLDYTMFEIIFLPHAILIIIAYLLFICLFIIRIKLEIELKHSILNKYIYLSCHFLILNLLFYGSHLGAKIAGRI